MMEEENFDGVNLQYNNEIAFSQNILVKKLFLIVNGRKPCGSDDVKGKMKSFENKHRSIKPYLNLYL